MARRARRKVRRSRGAGIKLLNVLESYTYASILSRGIMGASPFGVLTGKGDIESYTDAERGYLSAGYAGQTMADLRPGARVISLMDIIESPGDSLAVMQVNARNNLLAMGIQSFITGFGFRITKNLLRKPLANVNRNIMKPIFGSGKSGVAL